MMKRSLGLCVWLVTVACLAGCIEKGTKKSGEHSETQPTSSAGAKAPLKAVADPTARVGVIEGTVTVEGDPPLVIDAAAQKIPADCEVARVMYPPLFREGPGRTLADVFVGATGYNGVSQAKTTPVSIEAKGCAFPSRTYGLQSGQHLEIKSGDQRSYVPSLFGAKTGATLVAVPQGEAISVYHRGPGNYVLVNEMQIFAQAAILVVDYPTFDVTGMDGKFRITGVPEGACDVSAYLPSAKLSVSQRIEVRASATTSVNLKIAFNADAFKSSRVAPKSAAGVASTTPAQ